MLVVYLQSEYMYARVYENVNVCVDGISLGVLHALGHFRVGTVRDEREEC